MRNNLIAWQHDNKRRLRCTSDVKIKTAVAKAAIKKKKKKKKKKKVMMTMMMMMKKKKKTLFTSNFDFN